MSDVLALPTRRLRGGGDRVEQFLRLRHVLTDSDGLAARVDAHPAGASGHLLVAHAGEDLQLRGARDSVANKRCRRADDDAARRQVHAAAQSAGGDEHSQNVLTEAAFHYLALLHCEPCESREEFTRRMYV